MNNLVENLYTSLIPQWQIPDNTIIKPIKLSKQNNFILQENNNNIKQYVQTNFNLNNQKNNIYYENLNNYILEKIQILNDSGLQFDFVSNSPVQITNQDILFPICCVGKNRSQYLFYFLKVLQKSYSQSLFQVGYPASADELTTIIDKSKNSVLSGFIVTNKSDTLSKSVNSTLLNKEVSRSIHIFDSILKIKDEFVTNDLINFEQYKYKTSVFDIFNEGTEKTQVKELFINYYLNPVNLRNTINHKNKNYQNYRITYICCSPESYINMINLFYWILENNAQINFLNVRIVYLGIQDIFQRSSVNKVLLDEFYLKLTNSFLII